LLTHEQKSVKGKAATSHMTSEQRSTNARTAGLISGAVMTLEQKRIRGRTAGLAAQALLTPEQRSERGKKWTDSLTFEDRQKHWVTRRKNKELQNENKRLQTPGQISEAPL
jgi:hypothetical protein